MSGGRGRGPKRECVFHLRHEPGKECVPGDSFGDGSKIGCTIAGNFRLAKDRAEAIWQLAEEAHEAVVSGADDAVGLPLSSVMDLIRSAARGLVEENLPKFDEELFPREVAEQVTRPKAVPPPPEDLVPHPVLVPHSVEIAGKENP